MSPFLTVAVLTVLWLIVVVPMIVRRNDEHARDRSVDQFGRAMRALGRRAGAGTGWVGPQVSGLRSDVFVSGVAVRRPVPTAEEALMYPVDRSDMSEARIAMMARRRRSLTILGVGSLLTTLFAFVAGGTVWLLAIAFLASLAGYCLFLRSQATRDHARRQNRQARATSRRTRSYDVSDHPMPTPMAIAEDETVVRIDDDDLALTNMDTVDLTGLYNDGYQGRTAERRAS